jgi:hypothetical protein
VLIVRLAKNHPLPDGASLTGLFDDTIPGGSTADASACPVSSIGAEARGELGVPNAYLLSGSPVGAPGR